jgi:Domain of unknown function (DUF4359)
MPETDIRLELMVPFPCTITMSKVLLPRSNFLGILIGLSTIFAITNPPQTTYTKNIATYAKNRLEQNVCREAGFLHDSCLEVLKASYPDLENLINSSTKRKNLGFFSLYETELFILPLSPPYQIKAIGIAGQVYIYQEKGG